MYALLLCLRVSGSSFAGFFGCGGANRGAGPDAASSTEKQSEKTNCEAGEATYGDGGSGSGNGVGAASSGMDAAGDRAKVEGVEKEEKQEKQEKQEEEKQEEEEPGPEAEADNAAQEEAGGGG